MGRDVFGEELRKRVRQVLLHLSSGRGGAGKGQGARGHWTSPIASLPERGGGRYPEPLLGMLPCRDTDRTCAVQTSWAVVRVSGGCAPPASQFVNASAGARRPPGHLLPAAASGARPWLRASRYFPVYGWASALTGGCQLAGGVPPPTTQLQRWSFSTP